MSRLKNAPLLEVIFELRWDMSSQKQWNIYPYIHGDLFSFLKKDFPKRELLIPANFPQEALKGKPVYRFRADSGYPLYQLGPGLLTVNTTDKVYEWHDYSEKIEKIVNNFLNVSGFESNEKVVPSLSYFDFFKINWEEEDILSFLKEELNFHIKQNFYATDEFPDVFGCKIGYATDIGTLRLSFNTGLNNNREKGVVVQTRIKGNATKPDISMLQKWLKEAHEICSRIFKDMTVGKTY